MAKKLKTDLSGLNSFQQQAVLSDADRLLVLAGAGSGKTKTLLQRIIYLIEEKRVSPSNILAITFTKNAANEMLDRLIVSADGSGRYASILADKFIGRDEKNAARITFSKKFRWIENLTIKTFHGLSYGILRDFGVNEFDNQFRVIGDKKATDKDLQRFTAPETANEVLNKILIEKCESNEYLLDFKKYVLDYLIDRVHLEKAGKGAHYPNDRRYTTLNGTKVRSKSEQYIADWLFRHSIEFVYEPEVNFSDFNFHPDFYIPEANIYLEHVSNLSAPMKAKEEQFKKANKLLVKTFEVQTYDTVMFNLALDRIVKGRMPENYHFTKALLFEEEFKGYQKDVRNFLRQTMRVIDMVKVENIEIAKIRKKAENDQHERVRDFYKLAIPLVETYKSYCTNKSYLDFNDMITRTISLFRNQEEIRDKYKGKFQYILVDEFQDVNNLQVELIKLLLTESNKLFCVGDDWQSIYGFRGSNVDYIINFTSHFPNADVVKLNLNYRSTEHIVGASNEVIKNNKYKIDKNIEASKKSTSKIQVFGGQILEENIEFAVNEVKSLMRKGFRTEDILFLYRRNKMYDPYFKRFRQEKLFVSNKTIHASKGLEAKAVFIIGLTEGSGGFPDIWMEDRIYQIIKKSKHDLLLEEERRLFYVAITRAKDYLYLLTEVGNESSFIKEIPENYTYHTGNPILPVVEKVQLCPSCNSALSGEFAFCPFCGKRIISE